MIALRTSGVDENPAADSSFVSIPQPVGIRGGDLLLVGIACPTPGIIVTAPDETWAQIAVTDAARTIGMTVFWKIAVNEPVRWVFSLSAVVAATGAVMVYSNADGIEPIEAHYVAVSPSSSATTRIPPITNSLGGEEVVLFFGADDDTALWTTATGYNAVLRKTRADTSSKSAIAVQRQQRNAAGTSAQTTVTVIAMGTSLAFAVVLAPSVGTLSFDDVFNRIVDSFPKGVDKVYDLAPGGDYYNYFYSWAQLLKIYGFDLLDRARLEITPYLSRYKLPDWERVFGLTTTLTAKIGTIPQRQLQVLSSWRAAAGQGSTFAAVRAVLGPLLGYDPTTPLQIIETDRAALTALHTYSNSTSGSFPASRTIYVDDGGVVSQAGARLFINITDADTSNNTLTLTSPTGVTKTWTFNPPGAAVAKNYEFFGAEFAGAPINGNWTVAITGVPGTLHSCAIFVEGIATNQETGGAVFHWGIYADPAHLGESGVPANFAAVRAAIRKLSFAHVYGSLVQSLAPYPDVISGPHAAIPDECIPV